MTVIRSRQDLERMQANGEITTGDADKIRTFMDFLRQVPSPEHRKTPEGRRALRQAYAEHYPDDYAATVAAHTEKENTMQEPLTQEVHVIVDSDGTWNATTGPYDTQADAITAAGVIGHDLNIELVIHEEDGSVREPLEHDDPEGINDPEVIGK